MLAVFTYDHHFATTTHNIYSTLNSILQLNRKAYLMAKKKSANTREMIAMSFIRMFSDGPEVSYSSNKK